jgi:hypothetical protein
MNYLIEDRLLIFVMHFFLLIDVEFFLIIVHNYRQLLHVHKLVSINRIGIRIISMVVFVFPYTKDT